MFQVDGTVPSVVFDFGSHTSKVGYAGEDLPHSLYSSNVGTFPSPAVGNGGGPLTKRGVMVGDQALSFRRDGMDVTPAFDADGLVANWEAYEGLLAHAYTTGVQASARTTRSFVLPWHVPVVRGLVLDALRSAEPSTHKDLWAGICLTGGTSNLGGLFERLSGELMGHHFRARVLAASGVPERRFCTWTGGSILATFTDFQRMWVSKADYEEHGPAFLHHTGP
ncbi:hypothetical protein I4F81_000928 [Pyropia yezoensis]|uniref:Uncharacterized protein n=1 Tax=Pyropia yezoensis TaxID=2788 RepID=A0ACC3BK15_PYRYE|nr:hypothetical protein I4F81_000928 [Neopyropia yezoensis]